MSKSILFLLLLLTLFSGCKPLAEDIDASTLPEGYYMINRSFNEDSGFLSLYTDGYSVIDSNGKKVTGTGKDSKPALAISLTAKPADNYQYYSDTSIIDPISLNLADVSYYIPYNYHSSPSSSSTYLATCIEDGYKLITLKQDSVSLDAVFIKTDIKLRVVIYESTLKIYAKGLENESWG